MLNRWIKPNEDLQKVLDKAISDKWDMKSWDCDIVTHSFMMHADGSVEFNAEIRYDYGEKQVEFQRGFL